MSNGMSELDRRKAFWLLKKYSSLTTWRKKKELFDRFAAEVERLAKEGDYSAQNWLKGPTLGFGVYDEQIQYEKALERLAQGDRSCFRFGVDGSFSHTGVWYPYLERMLDPREYVFDEELYVPLLAIMDERNKIRAADIAEARITDQPAYWMPHWLLNEQEFGPFNFPDPLPEVPLHAPPLQLQTGEQVPCFGIWEPDTPGTCMNYLRAGLPAPKVRLPGARQLDTTWTLLWEDRRYEDGTIPEEEQSYFLDAPQIAVRPPDGRLRALPNDVVPKTGDWWSPAFHGANQVRRFEQGERFPATETTSYGAVIWYYDPERQSRQ